MSNTGQGAHLLKRFGNTGSRISRPVANSNAGKGKVEGQAQSAAEEGKGSGKITRGGKNDDLLIHRPSEISENVIFQDMDSLVKESPKKYQRNSRKTEPVQQEPPKNQMGEAKTMGAITNVFMGATTKFQKMAINTNISTPKKVEEETVRTPRNSQTGSQHSGFGGQRFARKKRSVQPGQEEVGTIDLSVNSMTPKGGQGTDRSNTDGKRIERTGDKSRNINWRGGKGRNEDGQVKQESAVQPGQSKITRETSSNITQTTLVAEEPKKPSPYINRQAKSRSQAMESTPQQVPKTQQVQNESKAQTPSVRKPLQRGRLTSQQEEPSGQKETTDKQEDTKPVVQQPARYGAKRTQEIAEKPQQQTPVKPVSRAGNRYGQNRVQQTQVSQANQSVKEEFKSEVKPVQRNINRYQANTAKDPVIETSAQETAVIESKPAPKPARYGANRLQQQQPPVQEKKEPEVQAKSTPRPTPNRYGPNKVQQSPVNKADDLSTGEKKPVAPRYGANRAQETPAPEKESEDVESKPVQRVNRYGGSRVNAQTVAEKEEPVQAEEKIATSRVSSRYGGSRVVTQTAAEVQSNTKGQQQPKEAETKPVPASRSRISSKAQPQSTNNAPDETPQIKDAPKGKPLDQRASGSAREVSQVAQTKSRPQSQVNSLAGSKIEEKIVLKKSPVIYLILKKIFSGQMSSSFKRMKEGAKSVKVRQTIEAGLLASSCAEVVRHKQTNLLRMGFDQLRRHLVSWYIPSIKPILTAKVGNPLQSGLNLLHAIVQSKVRKAFKTLDNKMTASNKCRALSSLQGLLRMKQKGSCKVGLQCILNSSKVRKHLIGQLVRTVSAYDHQLLAKGFNKLLSARKPEEEMVEKPSKPQQKGSFKAKPLSVVEPSREQAEPSQALRQKEQKMKEMNASLSENISKMESKMQDFKRSQVETAEEFGSRISALKEFNAETESGLTQKKSRNEHITKELAGLSGRTERKSVQDGIEPKSERLQVLASIYVGNFKLQDSVSGDDVSHQYNLEQADGNSLLSEWHLLLQNNDLKREIASFEQQQQSPSKARKTLMNEQKAILKLVRSYIKEQYLWQWLHVSVEVM